MVPLSTSPGSPLASPTPRPSLGSEASCKPQRTIRIEHEVRIPPRPRRTPQRSAPPPRYTLSPHGENWRLAAAEAQAFLKLAREPGGMVDKVKHLAAKLQEKGYVTADWWATDCSADVPVYRIEPPRKKQGPTWNDVREAPQRLTGFMVRRARMCAGLPRGQGNKHYHEIKPTADAGFVTARMFSEGIIPVWAASSIGNTSVGVAGSLGGCASPAMPCLSAAMSAGGIAGGIADTVDQARAWLDMRSAAKRTAIEIVANFHALLKVLSHRAGEEGAAEPQDADLVAARKCLLSMDQHPRFSKAAADLTQRCTIATVRDVVLGGPGGAIRIVRAGAAVASIVDGPKEVLSTGADSLGQAASGGLSPISANIDMAHSRMEHKFWTAQRDEAKATMAWLESARHLPCGDQVPPADRADRELFNAMLPACWQAHHDTAVHARFMRRCSYVRFFKGYVNGAVVWPLWVAMLATSAATLGVVIAVMGGCLGAAYLVSMSAKLGRSARRKNDQKNDQQAADIVMATRRGDGLQRTVRAGAFEVTTPRGTFVNGRKAFAGKKTHRVDVQLSPAMGLACFSTLVDKIVRDKPLDPLVHAALLKFLARRGVTELGLDMIKQSVLAAARMRKAADPGLGDEDDEWHRLQDLQNQLGPCFGLPRGATKLSDGVFLECFFGARLAQRAQTHAQENPARRQQIADCLYGAGGLLTQPAQSLVLLNRVARNLSEAAPGFHYRHCSDAEMQGIADQLFPGIPPRLFLEKCEHLLAMAEQARRKGDAFEWQVDGLPMRDLARFCRFVRDRWNRDVNAARHGRHAPVDAIEPDGCKDSYVRRVAEHVSGRYPLPWGRCGMGYAQRLKHRDGFALMTDAQVERCMQRGPELVPAQILEVRSLTGRRSDYQELLKREESGGDGSRPVVNMLLMRCKRDPDRLVMPGEVMTLAQIGVALAGRDDGLQLRHWQWAVEAPAPDSLQQSDEIGLCFKQYARDGRLRRHSVMVSRVKEDDQPDRFRVYDPATGEESSLAEASDMADAIKSYVGWRTRRGRVHSAALDVVDLFHVQAA